jgi:hypothetical protein
MPTPAAVATLHAPRPLARSPALKATKHSEATLGAIVRARLWATFAFTKSRRPAEEHPPPQHHRHVAKPGVPSAALDAVDQ